MSRLSAIAACLLGICSAGPALADLTAFVAAVGFDEEASLDGGAGIGVRWGASTRLLGGETALMIARPRRALEGSEETATAIFYEGRLLLNIPTGAAIRPFVGVGFGAITLTSTDVPAERDQALGGALDAVADAQTNRALSYGGGVRYVLGGRFDLRLDLRQYAVFSVKALAKEALSRRIEEEIGMAVPSRLVKDKTLQYNELSLGAILKF